MERRLLEGVDGNVKAVKSVMHVLIIALITESIHSFNKTIENWGPTFVPTDISWTPLWKKENANCQQNKNNKSKHHMIQLNSNKPSRLQ